MRPTASFDRRQPGFWISAGTHVALLGLALVTIPAPALPEAQEGVPVEVITENQFSEITKGERSADKPQPNAQSRADRKAETIEEREPENAKTDAPAAPKRTADMKLANADEMPLRANEPEEEAKEAKEAKAAKLAQEKAEAAKAEAAKAEAAKAAEQKAAAAKAKAEATKAEAAKAEAKAEAEKREQLAKLVEREEAEAEAQAKARAEAKAKADAEARRKQAEKAQAEKARAEAEAKAEAAEAAKAEAERQKQVAEAKAEAKAEAEREKAEAAAKARAEAAAKAKAKAMADAKAKSDAEAKARRQAELADKFSAGDIRSALAAHDSRSTGATGREVQRTAALGAATGTAQRLSPSLRDALVGMLQQQIERCYSAPPGAAQGVILPVLDIRLNPDGTLGSEPRIMRGGASSVDQSIAQAALRAVRRCAPYKIPAQYAPFYNDWKAINAEFEFTAT